MDFYTCMFALLAAVTGFLELSKRSEDKLIGQLEFRKFRFNYIVVYSLMMGEYCTSNRVHCSLRACVQSVPVPRRSESVDSVPCSPFLFIPLSPLLLTPL